MTRLKVAFVNQAWDNISPPVSAESIPIWTYETAKRLAQDCEVVIYARRDKNQAAVETYEGIEYRRVSVSGSKLCSGAAKIISKLYSSFRYLSSRLYYLPYALRVALDLRQQQCNVVHIHNFSQFVPIIRAFNPQIKIVLHMHCEWATQFEPAVISSRLAQTDLVVGCSDYITNKIKAQFPKSAARCQTVYNGVDTCQFAEAQELVRQNALQIVPDTQFSPNLLFVGRVSPEKGLHTLAYAFCQVVAQFPSAKLFIVGAQEQISSEFIVNLSDDPLVQNLAIYDEVNYLDSLKSQLPPDIADRVIFTGQISHLLLQDYFQRADVLINPSVSEAFGMSLVEAMATGTPTIGTEVGGMPEIVQHGETGFIVPPEQPTAMANAIAHLLSHESLREQMGEAGRTRAVEMFSWQAIATSLQHQYNLLSAEASPTAARNQRISQSRSYRYGSNASPSGHPFSGASSQTTAIQTAKNSGL
ncbi:MAG: glycosyltransferase family 4 protein [Phormidesmis sp.]